MVGFCIIAPLLDVFAKLASTQIPIAQITTFRFVVQALLMVPIFWLMQYHLVFPLSLVPKILLRAIFLIITTFCFVSAISAKPIADALAIVFVEPFILLIIGKLLFKEQVGVRRIGASLVGFFGVLLVIQPSFAHFGVFAFYMLVTRSLSKDMDPVPMQFHTALFGSIICISGMTFGQLYSVKQPV